MKRSSQWQGYHALEELPQVLNPASGWLMNTNHSPFRVTAEGENPDPAEYPPYMVQPGFGYEPVFSVLFDILGDNTRSRASRKILTGADRWWIYARSGRLERILRIGDLSPWSAAPDAAATASLTEDASGRVWIELNTMEGDQVHPVWIVWPPDRGPEYALRLPPVSTYDAFSSAPIMEIGQNYVLIASLNEDGAPVVRLLPLEKR